MMLLDPDPAGEITASLSRDKCRDRGMRDVAQRGSAAQHFTTTNDRQCEESQAGVHCQISR
jgi:hypothetical protein